MISPQPVNRFVIGNFSISLLGIHLFSRRCTNTETVIQRIIEIASSGGNDTSKFRVRKKFREKLEVHTNTIDNSNRKASCLLLVRGVVYVLLILSYAPLDVFVN